MVQRLISGAVLVPVVVVLFVLGPPWLTLGLALLAALAAYETRSAGHRRRPRRLHRGSRSSSRQSRCSASPGRWARPRSTAAGRSSRPAIALVIILAAAHRVSANATRPTAFASWVGTTFATLYPSLLAFVAAFVGLSR